MHPASVDGEVTSFVRNRELRVRIFGAGENFYALLACFALLEFLVEQSKQAKHRILALARTFQREQEVVDFIPPMHTASSDGEVTSLVRILCEALNEHSL